LQSDAGAEEISQAWMRWRSRSALFWLMMLRYHLKQWFYLDGNENTHCSWH
jgi:hypothetical protein